MQCGLVIFFGDARANAAELQLSNMCCIGIIIFFRIFNGASGY